MDLDTEDFGLAGGYGLHSYAGKKGKKVSHGCIREDIEDAEYVYNNCPVGTSVNIHN
jgi:lipoprotein-anchoring transpeptidase ErfK/SrfK